PATPAQLQRAVRWLEEASQKNPDSLALLMHLAGLRQLQQKYSEAEQLYRHILLRNNRNPIAMNNLAWLIALENGNKEEALDLINRAIELVGPVAELLDTRAVINLMRGKPELAIGDLRTALDEAPSATRYFHLARAQLETKNLRAAQASLKDAKELHLTRESIHPLEQQAY